MARFRNRLRLFVQCLPGLERLLQAEVRELGLFTGRRVRGGIEAEASTRQLYLLNRASRLATRVLLRVGHFQADSFGPLERGVAAIDWTPWVGGREVVVRASSSRSSLFHTDAISQRVRESIGSSDRTGSVAQGVHVRLVDDRVTLSVDTSGDALHHRGWRDGPAKAPLRPTLAAAMLRAVGYDGSGPLIDPFCGSGTIAIEAARQARHLPPAVERQYAFQHWPSFEPGTWASVAADQSVDSAKSVIASDRDAGAVAQTEANAARGEVAVTAVQRAISDVVNPGEGLGWLISNPPWGRRTEAADPRDLYARLGQVARRELPGWRVALLAPDERAVGHAGLSLQSELQVDNGGISVRVFVGVIPASSRA